MTVSSSPMSWEHMRVAAVQRGVALKVVQEWMGHKAINVTMRYAHLARANLLAAVSVLESETAGASQ